MNKAVPGAMFVDDGDNTLYLIVAARRPCASKKNPHVFVSYVHLLTSCGKLIESIVQSNDSITWLRNEF